MERRPDHQGHAGGGVARIVHGLRGILRALSAFVGRGRRRARRPPVGAGRAPTSLRGGVGATVVVKISVRRRTGANRVSSAKAPG